jgi:hypothetical protein
MKSLASAISMAEARALRLSKLAAADPVAEEGNCPGKAKLLVTYLRSRCWSEFGRSHYVTVPRKLPLPRIAVLARIEGNAAVGSKIRHLFLFPLIIRKN